MPKFAKTLVRLVYQPPPHTPLPQQYLSKDMHLNMKGKADRRLTLEKWPVVFIDENNLAEAGFYYTDYSYVVFYAFCVTWIVLGKKETMHLWNTGVGVRIASSLGVFLLGSTQLDLPTSLPYRLSSLAEAVTCMVLILCIDTIHIQNYVSIRVWIYSLITCAAFIAHHLF